MGFLLAENGNFPSLTAQCVTKSGRNPKNVRTARDFHYSLVINWNPPLDSLLAFTVLQYRLSLFRPSEYGHLDIPAI